jgi:phospholipase/lecithinase/hemolysin
MLKLFKNVFSQRKGGATYEQHTRFFNEALHPTRIVARSAALQMLAFVLVFG